MYKNNFSKWLLKAGDFSRGWSVHNCLEQLIRMEYFSADQLYEFKLQQLRNLLANAYVNVPLYRNLWNSAGVLPEAIKDFSDLGKLPLVSKKMFVEAGADCLNKTYPAKTLIVGRSSGSTGHPFVYRKDPRHHSWFIAGAMHSWVTAGWKVGESWVRVQYRGKLGLRAKLEDKVFNCIYLPIDELSPAVMAQFSRKLEKFAPSLIRGYAGAMYVFANYLLAENKYTIRPRAIVTTGHTLYSHYRETIEKAFGCRVYDAYGGEGIPIANMYHDGAYYVLPITHIEFEPLVDNRLAKVIVTSLTNLAMPFIRYDIGDLIEVGDAGLTGNLAWTKITKIVGRETDIVVTPSNRYLLCHHFGVIMRNFTGINQFQILQKNRQSIDVSLVEAQDGAMNEDGVHLHKQLMELTGGEMEIRISIVSDIPVPKSGKRRYVISEINK